MDENQSIKILIVDDHDIVVDGLTAILNDDPGIVILGSASDTNQLFALLSVSQPDIILLDIGLTPLTGLEALKIIRAQYPDIRCIMLSAIVETDTVIEALNSGARGYLSKNIMAGELKKCILEVTKGNNFIAESLRNQVLTRLFNQPASKGNHETDHGHQLTEREKEIVILFTKGLSYKEIAYRLEISVRTVESHKNNIQSKLGISTTADLIKFAIRSKLVDL